MNVALIITGKLIAFISRLFNLGEGSTWPGHIALFVNKNFVKDILDNQKTKNQKPKTVLVAGTNGKTTTGKLIQTILENKGYNVFQNKAGANLLNGIASSIVLHSSLLCVVNYDYAIFEIDENTLPLALKEFTPDYLIVLNLFRDQLDRYGETDTIARKWKEAVRTLPQKTAVLLNADDPQIAFLGKETKAKIYYFGLDDKSLHQKTPQHAVDSTYCPKCQSKLFYSIVYFSHLGSWSCKHCPYKRPKLDLSLFSSYPLPGIYNRYNTHAAVLFARINNINSETIKQSLKGFSPAFGRQEIIELNGKKVQLFLSKNPTSFNESLRTIQKLGASHILLVLNDRIPDGRDVSWIWDVDFEDFLDKNINIFISGDRCYDMGLRIKYAMQGTKFKSYSIIHSSFFIIHENLTEAIRPALDRIKPDETLFVLPTYSAMLEVRKILTGRKIL